MRIVMFRLLQIVFAIALLAIAFWPNDYWPHFSLFGLAKDYIGTQPYLVTIFGSLWMILLALNLPLSRLQFQYVGAICLVAIMGAIAWWAQQRGSFNLEDSNQWIILAIVSGGILLGWFTIASHIWRSYRGVYGVDEGSDGE